MTHLFRCDCGRIAGEIVDARDSRLLVCYCEDCRAYAHALGRADEMLDEHGGTHVLALRPRQIQLLRGLEVLRCLSLTPKGLLRWYAGCCGAPLANTPRNPRVAHVGMIHTCISSSREAMVRSFGDVRLQGFVREATSRPPKLARRRARALIGFTASLVHARLIGSYRRNPFFDANGNPVAVPRVLSAAQLERARAGLAA